VSKDPSCFWMVCFYLVEPRDMKNHTDSLLPMKGLGIDWHAVIDYIQKFNQ